MLFGVGKHTFSCFKSERQARANNKQRVWRILFESVLWFVLHAVWQDGVYFEVFPCLHWPNLPQWSVSHVIVPACTGCLNSLSSTKNDLFHLICLQDLPSLVDLWKNFTWICGEDSRGCANMQYGFAIAMFCVMLSGSLQMFAKTILPQHAAEIRWNSVAEVSTMVTVCRFARWMWWLPAL